MTKNDYVVCLLCGLNRILESNKRAEKGRPSYLIFHEIDLKNAYFVQVREGGGKIAGTGKTGKGAGRGKTGGSGFHIVEEECLTLLQAMQDPEYSEVIEGFRTQLIKLVRDALEVGFIKEDDL